MFTTAAALVGATPFDVVGAPVGAAMVASAFGVAAGWHFLNRDGTEPVLRAAGIPARAASSLARVGQPLAEAGLAAWIVTGVELPAAMIVAATVLAVYTVGLLLARRRAPHVLCNCFPWSMGTSAGSALWRNVGLIALCLWLGAMMDAGAGTAGLALHRLLGGAGVVGGLLVGLGVRTRAGWKQRAPHEVLPPEGSALQATPSDESDRRQSGGVPAPARLPRLLLTDCRSEPVDLGAPSSMPRLIVFVRSTCDPCIRSRDILCSRPLGHTAIELVFVCGGTRAETLAFAEGALGGAIVVSDPVWVSAATWGVRSVPQAFLLQTDGSHVLSGDPLRPGFLSSVAQGLSAHVVESR